MKKLLMPFYSGWIPYGISTGFVDITGEDKVREKRKIVNNIAFFFLTN